MLCLSYSVIVVSINADVDSKYRGIIKHRERESIEIVVSSVQTSWLLYVIPNTLHDHLWSDSILEDVYQSLLPSKNGFEGVVLLVLIRTSMCTCSSTCYSAYTSSYPIRVLHASAII